VQYIYMVFQ